MSKEAMKLALEALKDNQHLVADNERHAYVMEYNRIIEQLEEAMQQEQGEPMGTLAVFDDAESELGWSYDISATFEQHKKLSKLNGAKLYTTQQQRKPLTDETRNWIVATCPTPRHIIDAVERMHGIKE